MHAQYGIVSLDENCEKQINNDKIIVKKKKKKKKKTLNSIFCC